MKRKCPAEWGACNVTVTLFSGRKICEVPVERFKQLRTVDEFKLEIEAAAHIPMVEQELMYAILAQARVVRRLSW